MDKNRILVSFFLLLLSVGASASCEHKDVIFKNLEQGDIIGVYNEFSKWKAENPKTPEIDDTWAQYYNKVSYYKDIKTENQKPVGTDDYLESKRNGKSEFVSFDVAIFCDSVKKGYDIIDKSILKYPDCLHLYITKGSILASLIERDTHENLFDSTAEKKDMSEDERYHYLMMKALTHPKKVGDVTIMNNLEEQFVNFFSSLLDRSLVNKNKWYDLDNKRLDDGEERLIEVLQLGFRVLYEEGKYEYATKLNNKYLSVYPNHYYFNSHKSMVAIVTKDYKTALVTLKNMHEKFPKNDNNSLSLALVYELMGYKKEAMDLYQSLTKSKDKRIADAAAKASKRLNQKK